MHACLDIRELVEALPALPLEREFTLAPWLSDVRSALETRDVGIYTPVPRETHWDVSLVEWAGACVEERQDGYRRYIRRFSSHETDFAAYDPFAVEHEQRNRALTAEQLASIQPNMRRTHGRVLAAVGASGDHQLRALVCDGPRLLAWFGLLQSGPFRPAQQEAMQALLQPLGQRLISLRKLMPDGLGGALLEALFTEMAEVVFMLAPDGRVELANRAAEELLLSSEGRAELRLLREAVRGRTLCSGYRITQVSAPGLPSYRLAIRERHAAPSVVEVARAVRRWQLSPKLALVLERVCAGASNKEVASALGCAEVTVERHITSLFRASGARSRTELLAKVHAL